MKFNRLFLLTIVTFLSACGAKSGNAVLQFSDKLAVSLMSPLLQDSDFSILATEVDSVTSFKIRFIAAYLVEDVDASSNNVGEVAIFYLNPECGGDINGCGLAGGEGVTKPLSAYFDFTTAATANAAINASALSVKAGTYKYVRLDFCQGTTTDDQIQFKLAGMSAAQSGRTGTCGITSLEANPPITVSEGGTVNVTLAYDPKEFFNLSASDYGDGRCSNLATPAPSSLPGGYNFWCLGSINGSADDTSTGIVVSAAAQ